VVSSSREASGSCFPFARRNFCFDQRCERELELTVLRREELVHRLDLVLLEETELKPTELGLRENPRQSLTHPGQPHQPAVVGCRLARTASHAAGATVVLLDPLLVEEVLALGAERLRKRRREGLVEAAEEGETRAIPGHIGESERQSILARHVFKGLAVTFSGDHAQRPRGERAILCDALDVTREPGFFQRGVVPDLAVGRRHLGRAVLELVLPRDCVPFGIAATARLRSRGRCLFACALRRRRMLQRRFDHLPRKRVAPRLLDRAEDLVGQLGPCSNHLADRLDRAGFDHPASRDRNGADLPFGTAGVGRFTVLACFVLGHARGVAQLHHAGPGTSNYVGLRQT